MTTPAPRSSQLADLQHTLARTHRARLRRRRAIGAAAVALPALALAFALLPPSPRLRGEGAASSRREGGDSFAVSQHTAPPPSPRPRGEGAASSRREGGTHPLITIVRETPPVARMTDDELLAALAEAGHPSGLITINGETTIVANTFADGGTSPFAPLFGSNR